jgi:hypothetical protein
MKPRTISGLLTIGLLLMTAAEAGATSPWYFGTVVSASPADGNATDVKVLVHLDNYKKFREQDIRTFSIPDDCPVYLDWKRTTAKDAFAPGRTFTFFANHNKMKDAQGKPLAEKFKGSRHGGAVFVSTATGPAVPAEVGNKDCSFIAIYLSGVGDLASLAPEQKKVSSGMSLLLEVKEGKITGGAALTPGIQGITWHEMDPSDLRIEGKTVTGTAKVTFQGTAGKTKAATYTLSSNEKGLIFAGQFDGKPVNGKGTLRGQKSIRPGNDARLMLWTQDDRYGARRYSYLVCEFRRGAADSGRLCYRKSDVIGKFSGGKLTLSEGAIAGEFTVKGRSGEIATVLNATVLDGRFVLAELTVPGSKTPIRAYGFLVDADASPLYLPGSD